MTDEEITLLESEAVRRTIELHIDRDPTAVALDRRIPHSALVATQIKNLQRVAEKLPSFFAARCIVPTRASQQASSEAVASARGYAGRRCVDLTCGLGADALALSRAFRTVTAVEADPRLARIARINFRRLGAGNIEVVCAPAEEYVAAMKRSGERADLVFLDPDRRDGNGRRLYDPQMCSPDPVGLMPALKAVAGRVAVKNSPMFDPDEAQRVFGPDCRITMVSVGGECKELDVEAGEGVNGPAIGVIAIPRRAVQSFGALQSGQRERICAEFPYPPPKGLYSGFEPPYRYLAVPDAALRATRTTQAHLAASDSPPLHAYVTPDSAYAFLQAQPRGFIGRVFEISFMKPYRPRALRKELAGAGIGSAEITAAGFPGGARAVLQALGLRPGGDLRLAVIRAGGTVWVIGLNDLYL